jgi:hypothetical protein
MLAGGIGGGAINVLNYSGIEIVNNMRHIIRMAMFAATTDLNKGPQKSSVELCGDSVISM